MSDIRHLGVAPTEVRHLASGDEVDMHRHDDHQLVYASSGVLEVTAADGTWFTPSTRAVWIPAGTVHHWQVHGTTTVHLVGVPDHLHRTAVQEPVLVLATPLFRELVVACTAAGPVDSPAVRRLLGVLVDQVRPVPQPASMLPVLLDPRLRAVQAIIEGDMSRPLTLAEAGRRVGAGERTLSRLFHDAVGMSFTVWRNQVRLHRANLLLAEGRTVTQASVACGYSSPSSFITAFRTAFGRTPGSLYR